VSFVFTPPTVNHTPPVSIADSRHGAPTERENPLGFRLMRYYSPRPQGVAVFKMSDGSYQMGRSVEGLPMAGNEPYPATVPKEFPQVVNGEMQIAGSNVYGVQTYYPATQPEVAFVYYGGHVYNVSSTEAAALTAAGFGAYIT
jgi:hypothetical protein